MRYLMVLMVFFIACHNPEQVEPIIVTGEVQNIGSTEATFVGELQDTGVTQTWVYGFVYSDNPGPNIVSGMMIVLGERATTGEFSAKGENLTPATTYYVRSFVSDASYTTIYYGQEVNFNTQ